MSGRRSKKTFEWRASLVFLDESGFCLTPPVHRTWSPRGETPQSATTLTKGRINVIGSLIISPRYRAISIHAHLHFQTMDSDRVVAFLTDLLRQVPGRIVLLWDNAPIHGDSTVKKFLKAHPRLRCYPFPAYAPELNPAEGLWAQTDHILDDHLCNDLPQLTHVLCHTFCKLKASSQHLWGCVFGSDLPWKH